MAYGIGQTITFSCCVSIYLLFFPRLISAAAHWCGLSANLECMSECAERGSLKMQDPKKSPKIAIWAPSHNFVGLCLRNQGMYRQSEKKLLSSNMSSACAHNVVNFGPLVAVFSFS